MAERYSLRVAFRREADGRLRVAVSSGSTGDEDERDFRPRLTPAQWDSALAASADANQPAIRRSGDLDVADPAQDVGGRLFEAVFGGRLGSLYRQEVMRAQRDRAPLEIRIAGDGPEREALPWELLYDFMERGDFVALSRRWSLVREFPVPSTGRRLLPVEKLRALLLKKAGEDAAAERILKTQSEQTPGAFESEVRAWDGGAGLPDAIAGGFQIVHVAPGPIDALIFPLMDLLGDSPVVQLLVLEGGSTRPMLAEFAPRVPAAIGMHLPMLEMASSVFLRVLYRELVEGQTIGAAVGLGRKAIDRETPGSRQWALPVLSIVGDDAPLLEVARAEPAVTKLERTEESPPRAGGKAVLELAIAERNRDALRERADSAEGAVPAFVEGALARAEADVKRLEALVRGE